MAVKSPIRYVFDNDGNIVEFSEFLGSDFIGISDGGTGATTASGAAIALGLEIGVDVQAYDINLDQLAALNPTDSNFIVGNGSEWVVESGSTVRDSLGLGTSDDVQFNTIITSNLTVNGPSIALEGATDDSFETTLLVTDPTADRTITFPDATGTVLLDSLAQTVTNKTIDYDDNTIQDFELGAFKDSVIVTESEGIGSNDSDTQIATTAAIIDYVGAQLTLEELDFAGDTGTGAVDLDSQSLTIAGTANEIETSASGQTLTIGLPDDVTIGNSLTVTGNLTVQGSTTSVESNTVTIGDAILELNADETGAPSANAGLEVNRGTSTDVSLLWDESNDRWTVGSYDFVAATFIGNLTGNVTGTVSDVSNHDTDDIAEGSTNLYYTDAKVGTYLTANSYATETYVDNAVASENEISEMNDVTLTSLASGEFLQYNGTAWVNIDLDTDDIDEGSNLFYTTTRANTDIDARVTKSFVDALNVDADTLDGIDSTGFATSAQGTLADSALQSGDNITELTNNANYIDLTDISVTDSGGDGSLSYDNTTGVITYTGPSQAEVLAHISGGTGITVSGAGVIATTITQYADSDVEAYLSGGTGVSFSSGVISIGQAVGTTDNVTFNDVTVDGILYSNDITADSISVDGNATITGNLTVQGTTTTVDSTTVTVADPLFKYADANAGNSVDIGFYGEYVQSATTKYAGLVWDASQSDKFRLFHGLQTEPTTTVDITATGHTVGTLIANLEGDVTGNADTATALASGQNFSLTGDVTATAISFDGTGAVALSTTVTESAVTQHEAALTITESQISDLQSYLTAETNDLTSAVTWANVPDANITQSSVTQHQAALSITESQISDLQSYLTAETNDLSSVVTWANVPDANITESSVTQHEAALSITESQISDLGSYITAISTDTLTNKTINFEDNTAIVEYAVTVSGGNFLIDGEANATISFNPGIVYRFDLSDSSTASHPFALSETEDGTHNSGSEYTTGKTSNGTQGSTGAYVEYTVNAATPDILYYYCSVHSGMGGTVTVFGSSYGDSDVQAYLSAGAGISISGSGQISSTITQYADSDVEAYLSGGTGVTFSSGVISIGQAVGTSDNVTFNDVTVSGDLIVSGTTTTINTETIELADNIIVFNSNATGSASQDAGIEIERGDDANKTLIWNETDDKWTVGSETFVAGTFEGNLTGDVTEDVDGAIIVSGKNETGSTIGAGVPVYISGQSGSGTEFTVDVADSDGSGTMPAIGITTASANDNAEVSILTFGRFVGLDTSSFSVGDELYVSTTGTLTTTPPTGETALLQKIAKVIRSHASDGEIFVQGAGRSNAVPNLDNGDIFIGNASNQAVTASFNTTVDGYLSGGTGIDYTSGTISVDSTAITGQSALAGSVDTANDFVLLYDDSSTSLTKVDVATLLASAGSGSFNDFNLTADTGTPEVVADGNTVTIAGGTGIDTAVSTTDTVTVSIDNTVITTSSSIGDLSDVDITTSAPTDGQALVWNASNSEFEPGTVASSTNYFQTIAVSGQSDIVPDSTTDTLNFAAGANITLTTDASTDTVTIAATGGAANAFSTLAVAGQSDVVADAETDTLTLTAGTGMTITTDAGTDTITFASSGGGGGSLPVILSGSTSDPITLSDITVAGAIPFTSFDGTTDNIQLGSTQTAVTTFADNDADTSIELERTSDDDTVYIKAGGTDVVTATSSGVTITNLTVTGTTTQANELKITDTLFELNADGGSLTTDAGMIIERGSTGDNAAFIWDESADAFVVGTTATDGSAATNLTVTEATLKAATQTQGDNSTNVATTAYVDTATAGISSDTVTDADGDTLIEVENSDADEIVMTTAGQERLKVDNNVSMSARGGFFTHQLTMDSNETFTIASTEGTVAAGPLDIQGTVDVQGSLVVL